MSNCVLCSVAERAVCGVLTPEEREDLGRQGKTRHVRRGQTLMWEGEDSALVANVQDGMLKLSISTSDGREQIVGIVYPGDFIGRPFAGQTGHTVTALTDARLCLFPRAAFDRFASQHPALGSDLLRRALDELDRTRQWMLLLGRKTAEEKLASFVLEMSARLAVESENTGPLACRCEDPLDSFRLPLDRQQIADILGLTIETVSRQLSRLKTLGAIALPLPREISIRDRPLLIALAGA